MSMYFYSQYSSQYVYARVPSHVHEGARTELRGRRAPTPNAPEPSDVRRVRVVTPHTSSQLCLGTVLGTSPSH